MNNDTTLSDITLRHFLPEDQQQFVAMVDDPEIKNYYREFNDDYEVILSKFNGINTNVPAVQYWGIFDAGNELAGFITLKRNHSVFKTLQKLEQSATGDAGNDFTFETDEQIKKRERLEKLQSPYAVEIAIHPAHRERGFARLALTQVYEYAAKAGLKEIYFEVRQDNEKSRSFIESLRPVKVVTAEDHHGHDLYCLRVTIKPVPDAELLEQIKAEKDMAKQKLLVNWRYLVRDVPELTPHRELVMELFEAIALKGASIDFHKKHEGCSHSIVLDHHFVNISLSSRPDPTTLIWSIAHEYGHLLQEDAQGDEKSIYTYKRFLREQDAWLKAGA
ncbi:GNAT family N-acetyltransferase [Mucilaginibacter sp. E4BP6]|uniref:GNAT family N-acetyltransferase n=1 Tax=Mucilaginibacter sp. E4BP6 TaxID=2723089 RepID=UPI0015CCD6B5|nr:GNAT family N-acetyltransferase [Mucilaginibacter sp. E4BP6]NYE66896.1 putative acetyltransferase [Mucilaginibacter sp. E4BP6]